MNDFENLMILQKVQKLLSDIRPFLIRDGGDLKIKEFKDGNLYLTVIGSCIGCKDFFIEFSSFASDIKEEISGINEIIFVDEKGHILN